MFKLTLKYSSILLLFFVLNVTGAFDINKGANKPEVAWLPIVALGASVLGSVLQGASQRRQARELEAQNVRPTYRQSTGLQENRAIAQQMASVGLPNQVYNNQLNQMQQNFATGLRQIGQRGNTAVNANALIRGTNQSVQNLNALDAQARQQATQSLLSANNALANEQRAMFQDQNNQFLFNAQNIASQRRAGTQNIFGGLGMLAQGALMGAFATGTGVAQTGIANTVNPNTLQPLQQAGGLQGFNLPQTLPFRQYF